MLSRNETVFMECDKPYNDARFVLFGAPFDSTTSYRPGSRFASAAMRQASWGLETYSPYLDKDLTDCPAFDAGDLELCFGDSTLALGDIEKTAEQILNDGKVPVLLGGEHLVTLGSVRAAVKKYPDLNIIHFDAHTDLRDDYLGVKLSHAAVLRRCHELVGDGKIFQFGIRSGLKEEFDWAKQHTCLHKYDFDGLREVLDKLDGKPVYFTVDMDVLDPSVFPGTGTPEPGGVQFLELMKAVTMTAENCNIIGCDLVELAPELDHSGVSTLVACKLLRELLLALGC